MTIAQRLTAVNERVEAAAARSGRAAADVLVVAVSKSWGIDALLEGLAAGIADLGENRAQELAQKMAALGEGGPARWHFIGHLQTNKVRQVVGRVALVHSVDRFGLAEAIASRARSLSVVQHVLIEVNLAGEPAKAGVTPAEAIPLVEEIAQLPGLSVRGLMTIPPEPSVPEDSRPYFKQLAALGKRLERVLPNAVHLSMGMTRDFEVAIEEGATIVRIGEAIFGPRRQAVPSP